MLKVYQKPHVQNLKNVLRARGVALDGSDTGTGKTYSAIMLAKVMRLRPFIICPKPVIETWYEVARKFSVQIMVANYECLKFNKYYASYSDFRNEERSDCSYIDVIRSPILDDMTLEPIIGRNGKPKMEVEDIIWMLPDNTLLIFDEAHKGKNGIYQGTPTINSQIMISAKMNFSFERKIYGLFLSATITDHLKKFDTIAFLLGLYRPYTKPAYARFMRNLSADQERRYEQINAILYPELGSRMNIKAIQDVAQLDFKENDIEAIACEIPEADHEQIEEAHREIRDALFALRNMISNGTGEAHPLVRILRARQKIELLKIPIFVNKILEYRSQSIVVFLNFNQSIDTLVQQLFEEELVQNGTYDFIRGGQTPEERKEVIERFQNDEIRLLICNIASGGVGISLHDLHGNYPRVSLISPTWTAIDIKQALGRIHRSGAQSNATQRIIFAKTEDEFGRDGEPGVEERMCFALNAKLRHIAVINDGDLQNYYEISDQS